jgi:anti-sigma factor RsiW
MHPEPAEWTAFLYGELDRERQKSLEQHLERCEPCSAQVEEWRASMASLDQWSATTKRQASREWTPMLKLAAAAVILVLFGFTAGRLTGASRSEVAELRNSLAQLRNENVATRSNIVVASVSAANANAMRLLADYSRSQNEQRTADRQSLTLVLAAMDARLAKMRSDLETVAFNTETGFQVADENLTRVASLTLADKN